MKREQRIVAIGAASGLVAMLAAMYALSSLLPAPEGMHAAGDRIAYALGWCAFAALPLFFMIAAIGNARFASDAIDPTAGAESRMMIVNGRVADNTLQQFALFLAGSLGLAANLPPERMTIVAAAAITFVAARLCFWIGYRIEPLYRAFGFAATAYLNLGLLAGAVWLAIA